MINTALHLDLLLCLSSACQVPILPQILILHFHPYFIVGFSLPFLWRSFLIFIPCFHSCSLFRFFYTLEKRMFSVLLFLLSFYTFRSISIFVHFSLGHLFFTCFHFFLMFFFLNILYSLLSCLLWESLFQ